jgi:DNA-binding NarL/FixJ family response regulator
VTPTAASAAEALEVVEAHHPDLVLVDLILGDGPDGIQLTKAIRADRPVLPVLVLSGRDETLFAERALLAGASGYLMKDEAVDVLFEAMEAALADRIWVSAAMRARLLPPPLSPYGSPSDIADELGVELLRELRRGNRTVGGISRAVGRGHATVDRGLEVLADQLGLPSRAALYLYVQPEPVPT